MKQTEKILLALGIACTTGCIAFAVIEEWCSALLAFLLLIAVGVILDKCTYINILEEELEDAYKTIREMNKK